MSQGASEWQLKLNIKKSAEMHMGYNNPNFVYTINNVDVNVVFEKNDLGITVKSSLHFDSYIICAITSSTVFALNLQTF